MKKHSGFTLIEIMITMGIVGVLLTLGVPSLKSFMQSNQLIATTNEMLTTLHIARSEAIKLNKRVSICDSNDGKTCANVGDWTSGWIVFTDATGATPGDLTNTGLPCVAANVNTDCILRIHDAIADPLLTATGIYDSNNAVITSFTFTSRGLPKGANGAAQSGIFSICSFDSSDTVIDSRAVVLSLSGRVRVSDNAAVINCPLNPL